MTSRHHYTIPGASLIRSRRDSTTPIQRPTPNNPTATSNARDSRQPAAPSTNPVRSRVTPDVISSSKPLPSARPPSVMGYPAQPSSAYPSTSRPTPPQRPPSVYGASSSKPRVEASDSRNVFSKMFSRKTTLAPTQPDERGRGTDRDARQRSSSRPPASRGASIQPSGTTNPLVREMSRDEWAKQRAKKEKEERDRERDRDREREERRRAEYAVYRARQEEAAKQVQAQASAAPTTRPATVAPRDRSVSRAGREYESDAARRRPAGSSRPETRRASQFLFPPAASIANQGSKDSQTRHPQQPPQTQPAGIQQVASVQPQLSRPHGIGVPVQDSNSSQSTAASQRVQSQPIRHLQNQNTESKPSPAGASVRSVAHTPVQVAQRAPSSSPEERQRIIAEAVEREREKERQALARRDREHRESIAAREREVREREAAAAREREAQERENAAAREREAVIAREKEREKEREEVRQKEAELLEHERRQKELEKEQRRVARRAERERMKEQERQHERQERLREIEKQRELERQEAERLERERQEKAEQTRLRELERQKAIEVAERREQERVEREIQKEAERLEKERKEAERQERLREQERLEREKAQQQEAAEKQREIEKANRERQESERAEKERIKIERMQRELDRLDRERKEKERERAQRAAARHRGQRDKTQSTPANYMPTATTVTDAEKLLRQGRHRSQSQPLSAGPQMQSFVIPTDLQVPETSKINASPIFQPNVETDNFDEQSSSEDGVESPIPLPIPPPTMDRDHVLYPRSGNATVPPGPHKFSAPPDQMPHFEPSAVPVKRNESTDTLLGASITSAWIQPPLGVNPSKRVSIFASQGPPDRSQYKNGQRRASFHPDSSFGASRVRANGHSSGQNGDSHNSAAQFFDTGDKYAPQGYATIGGNSGQLQVPPPPIARHSMIFPKPSSESPEYSALGHHDQLEDDALFPRTRAEDALSEFGTRTQDQIAGSKLNSDRPSGRAQMAASSYSQYAASIKKLSDSNAPTLDPPTNTMQRAGSDNSTRRQSLQAHAAPVSNTLAVLPISRTASDASQSTEKGSTSVRPPPLLLNPTLGSSSQPPLLPSSGQTFASASRVPLESAKSPQSTTFAPSHTHSHSVPSTASAYPYSVSLESRVASSRQDNVSGTRNPASRASTSILQLPNAYPAYQQASPQDSKFNYTSSSNVSYPAQTQTTPHSQPPLSTNQPYAMHPHMPSTQILSSQPTSDMLSPQNVNQPPSSHMYHTSSESRTTPHPTQAQHPAPLHRIPPVNHATAQESATRMTQPTTGGKDDSPSSDYRNDHQDPVLDGGEPKINPTLLLKVPDSKQQPPPLLTPTRAMAPSLPGRPRSSAEHGPRTPTQALTPTQISKATPTLQDSDSPPGLTPSSSKESLDEVLMTPASLINGRVQAQASSSTDTLQRAEKKKGGFFGMFRSSSKQDKERERTRDKDSGEKEGIKRVNVKAEVRAYEAKTPTPGPSQSRSRARPESRGKRARPASIMEVFAQQSNNLAKPTKTSRNIPPPIHIPLDPQRYRLVSNKTKHYRSVSVASQEALDGTANNTVVGSPQSSRRSPTLSGPLTPSVRDPVEAADAWRKIEEAFVDHGSTRRRRPGVTFDLMGEDAQKDGAEYRSRKTRRQRRDSPM